MSNIDENPFKMLGLDPRILKDLFDNEIFALAKAQYKTLMVIFHPDTSRRKNAAARSRELSDAFKKIDLERDPKSFTYWKEEFLKRAPRGKSAGKGLRDDFGEIRERRLQDVVLECLKEVYLQPGKQPVASLPYLSALPVSRVNAGCALLLIDTPKALFLASEHIKTRGMFPKEVMNDPTVFELEVSGEGTLTYRGTTIHPLLKKDVRPPEETNWVHANSLGVGQFWTVQPTANRTLRARIVGSISADRLRQFWDEAGAIVRRQIDGGLTADETSIVESTGYVADQVRPYLWFFRPNLQIGNIVVSMNPEGDKFIFLGKLLRAAERTKAPST